MLKKKRAIYILLLLAGLLGVVAYLVLVWKPQIVGSPQPVGGDFIHQVGEPQTSLGLRDHKVGQRLGFQTETI